MRNSLRKLADYAVYLLVRLVICFAQSCSLATCQSLADSLGWLMGRVIRFREQVVLENLQAAFPERSPEEHRAMLVAMWQHLLLLMLEIAHVPRKIHQSNWRDHIHLVGHRWLCTALIDNRATVVVSGHFGNFELGSYLLALFGYPTHSVARVLDNPYLHQFVNDFRSRHGQHMIAKNGGFDDIVHVLESQGTLCLLGDQYAGQKGCWVDFFHRPASTHKAIALFCLQYDAPLIVCSMQRTGAPLQYEIRIEAVADPRLEQPETRNVKSLTQWYTHQLEHFIRRAPEQYWWVHRRWKSQPARKRKAKRAA